MARLKAAAKKIDEGQSRWLVGAGGQGSEYHTATLGHSSTPDLTGLIDTLTAEIITSCGQTASSLGYTLRSKGASKEESNNKQTISNIENKQRRLVSALNSKLYRLLPLIESETPSGTIIVRMERPDLSSVKEAEETQILKINNAILQARAGIISSQTVATSLGHKSIADEERFTHFISQEQGEENPNDPNKQQQARIKILGKGRTAGNNPTGEK